MNYPLSLLALSSVIITTFLGCQSEIANENASEVSDEFTTPLGKTYLLATPSTAMTAQYVKAKQDFDALVLS